MNISYTFDPEGKVTKIIKSWKPKDCKTEKDFEKSLLMLLRINLDGIKIEAQYGAGRQKVDIVVDDKIPIEIKKDVNTAAALHRAMGQLEQYLLKWDLVFLVLCGRITPENLAALKEYAKSKITLQSAYEERIVIIDKTIS